jgi:gluconate 2-dehydrogenase gamma chain
MPGMEIAAKLRRRDLLCSTTAAFFLGSFTAGCARTVNLNHPWVQGGADPPTPIFPGQWRYFTPEEATTVVAIADRLIPADDASPGGGEAGCAVFVDAQLAGSYGSAARMYMRPPFLPGTPQQGGQSPLTPAQQYRAGLAALDAHCIATFVGKRFGELTTAQQDDTLARMEKGQVNLAGIGTAPFFELLLQNVMEGFFADPIYGGNRDMVGWKLIGFPGARYDYSDYIDKHNQPFPLPPVGLQGRREWKARG